MPTIYINLLAAGLEAADLGSVGYEFSAAATLPAEMGERWESRFGRPIYEGYGLTESSPFACYNHDFARRPGTVGTAVENFELRIVDELDQPVEFGTWGEIVIRGPGVMQGYWKRPEETAQALRGGWFHSGDVGTMDDDGYVAIVDRVKDMINVSGFKVWSAEVEAAFYTHPAVLEAAVYGDVAGRRRSLLLAVGCCRCCHHCCQPRLTLRFPVLVLSAGPAAVTRLPEPSLPRGRHRRSDRDPALAAGEDAFVPLRRCAGDRDRPAGAACPGRLMGSAGMPDCPRQMLAPAVAAYQCLFSQSARIGVPIMSKRSA